MFQASIEFSKQKYLVRGFCAKNSDQGCGGGLIVCKSEKTLAHDNGDISFVRSIDFTLLFHDIAAFSNSGRWKKARGSF